MYNFAQNIKKIFLKMHVSEICVKRIPVNQELGVFYFTCLNQVFTGLIKINNWDIWIPSNIVFHEF